jgi:hypothetical protein
VSGANGFLGGRLEVRAKDQATDPVEESIGYPWGDIAIALPAEK